jgi:hypothetical protein
MTVQEKFERYRESHKSLYFSTSKYKSQHAYFAAYQQAREEAIRECAELCERMKIRDKHFVVQHILEVTKSAILALLETR